LGRLEEAAELLAPHINRMEIAAVERMKLDLKLRRFEEARRDARALTLHFEQAQRSGERFDSPRYQAWAKAAQLLGDRLEWARLVRAWLAVDPENKLARKDVAELNRREFDEMLRSSRLNAEELAKRLTEVMRLVDNPASLESQIVYLYGLRDQSPALTEMFQILTDADDGPPALTAAIGTAAAASGDVLTARRLLGEVVISDDGNAIAWNNYAWALAQEPAQDLAKALAAANRALELSPEEFRFRETRGQVLVALGQWEEAVKDLEFALNGMPDVTEIHSALATAYEHLGEKALADIHRQQTQ
jgi:tetratricopeptide (TPR) repeat protein